MLAVPVRRAALLVGAALASLVPPGFARDPGPAPDPAATAACGEGRAIGRIEIERVGVFDPSIPGEGGTFYRFVNVLHRPMQTRVATIRRFLPLRTGDPCDLRAIEEAERILRGLDFVQDAWVVPAGLDPEDRVIVRVRVQDTWSTRLRVSWASRGGESRSTFRVQEANLLGTGNRLAWERREDEDRVERTFTWEAPAIGGDHFRALVSFSDNSDGEARVLQVARPFWKLDARWALDGALSSLEEELKVYRTADARDLWHHEREDHHLWWGHGSGLVSGEVRRWTVGVRRVIERWTPLATLPGPPPGIRPRDRDLVLGELHWEWRRVDYRRVSHLETARRIEDLDLGSYLGATVALSLPGLSEQSGGSLLGEARTGFALGEGAFAVLRLTHGIERLGDEWLDAETRLEATGWQRLSVRRTFRARLVAARGSALEGHRRILLGGGQGLRGYRSRAFSGSNLVLLQLEHRTFTSWEPFRLFRVGWVAFVEAGAAWDEGEPLGWDRVHPDAGVGLRLFLLRSSGGTTLHLDLAYPLDPNGDPGHRSLRYTFVTARGF